MVNIIWTIIDESEELHNEVEETPWPFPVGTPLSPDSTETPCSSPEEETPEEAYDRAMGPLRKG